MTKLCTSCALLLLSIFTNAQTNNFPANGPVGIGTYSPPAKLTVTGNSIANAGSQTNISAFIGNGLRIISTGGTYSQDGIMYQSGLNGGGAGISFGRNQSWDTWMGFYTNAFDKAATGSIVERMRLDDYGRLGIGTIAPSTRLHVVGSANFSSTTTLGTTTIGGLSDFGMFYADRGNDLTEVAVHNQGAGAMLYANPKDATHPGMWSTKFSPLSTGLISNPNYPLVLGAGGEAIRILPNGNIGIGTASPGSSNLAVHAAANPTLSIQSNGGVNNKSIIDLKPWAGRGGGAPVKIVATDAEWSAHFSVFTAAAGTPQNTGNSVAEERFRITNNGNVGVGTVDPKGRFTVSGSSIANVSSQTNISAFTGNGLRINSTGGTYSQDGIMYQSGENGGGAGIAFGRNLSWDTWISFYTNPYDNAGTGKIVERMRLDDKGNLGIGTANPNGYKLAVNGPAIFTKVQVKAPTTPFPDYVFKPNYNLRSLEELEKFIKRYNHLPEVPSAEDVEKEGLDLAETQAVLLKKIEELTLYVIEQGKVLKNQKVQILNQEGKIEFIQQHICKID